MIENKLTIESCKLVMDYIQSITFFLRTKDCEELADKFQKAYDELSETRTQIAWEISKSKEIHDNHVKYCTAWNLPICCECGITSTELLPDPKEPSFIPFGDKGLFVCKKCKESTLEMYKNEL